MGLFWTEMGLGPVSFSRFLRGRQRDFDRLYGIISGRIVFRLLTAKFGKRKSFVKRQAQIWCQLARLLRRKKRLPEAKLVAWLGIVRYPAHRELNLLNLSLAKAGATQNVVSNLVSEIESFCLFLGYPGSGHSVVRPLWMLIRRC